MAVATSPFVLKDVTLTLLSNDGITPQEMRCQLNEARLVPSAASGGGEQYITFCDTHSNASAGDATWVLRLAGFQSYADINDLARLLFEKEGQELDYILSPYGGTPTDTTPAFEGKITAIPVDIGGTANAYATFTTDQPCTGKPLMVTA